MAAVPSISPSATGATYSAFTACASLTSSASAVGNPFHGVRSLWSGVPFRTWPSRASILPTNFYVQHSAHPVKSTEQDASTINAARTIPPLTACCRRRQVSADRSLIDHEVHGSNFDLTTVRNDRRSIAHAKRECSQNDRVSLLRGRIQR
jgi:hypothetical protein